MADSANNAINLRIFRTMAIATGLSVAASALFSPWRVTTGLLLGGILALFSYRNSDSRSLYSVTSLSRV
jgi:uncharacterized membrane protein YGL010W